MNNEICGNKNHGIYLEYSTSNVLTNNTICNNSGYAFYIDQQSSGTNITNAHVYNNTGNAVHLYNGGLPMTVYFNNLTLDNPHGNFQNYTSISMQETIAQLGTAYEFNWTTNSSSLPPERISFAQKYVIVTRTSGNDNIDTLVFNWNQNESTGYNKDSFELWKHNSSGWSITNAMLNTTADTLTIMNMSPDSTYGILQNNTTSLPNASSFNGVTTNFSQIPDLRNATNIVLETIGFGKLRWLGSGLSVSGADFDHYVLFGSGWVSVDAAYLDSTLNSSANISLYGLPYTAVPVIYANNAICSDCTVDSYIGNSLSFHVNHFTNYSTGSNSNLTIYDQYENSSVPEVTSISFYANYTNITNGANIAGATCLVDFDDGTNGTMVDTGSQYNYTKVSGFSAAGTHYWNVTCNKTGYEILSTTDDIIVTSLNITGNGTSLYQANITNYINLQRFVYNSSGNETTEGGNISGANIYTEQLTDRWAAFFGNITGSIILTDKNGANNVYEWGWTPTTGGAVCTSTNSSVTDLTLYPASGDDIDTAWGFAPLESDSGRNTFYQTGCDLTIGTTMINNVSYADTGQPGGFITCSLKTQINVTKPDMFFCTDITQNGTFWNGQTGDFELMVPTTFGNNVYETYYFYVNLN